MIRAPYIRKILRPSWEKSIMAALVVCGFFLFHFRYQAPRKLSAPTLTIIKKSPEFATSIKEEVPAASYLVSAKRVPLAPIDADLMAATLLPQSSRIPAVSKVASVRTNRKVALAEKLALPLNIDEAIVDAKEREDKTVDALLAFQMDDTSSEATDEDLPLEDIAREAFAEPSFSADFQKDWKISSTQNDLSYVTDPRLAAEPRVQMIVGTYKQDDFRDLRAGIAYAKSVSRELLISAAPNDGSEKPEPTLVNATPAGPKLVKKKKPATTNVAAISPAAPETQELVQLRAPTPEPTLVPPTDTVTEGQNELVRPKIKTAKAATTVPENNEPTLVRPETNSATIAQMINAPTQLAAPIISGLMASGLPKPRSEFLAAAASAFSLPNQNGTGPLSAIQPKTSAVNPQTSAPTQLIEQQIGKSSFLVSRNSRTAVRDNKFNPDSSDYADDEGDTIDGTVSMDMGMARWFEEEEGKVGHIELHLDRIDREDLSLLDNRVLRPDEYQFPSETFRIDGQTIKGRYKLVARFYSHGLVSEIAYLEKKDNTGDRTHDFTTVSNQTRRLNFHLTRSDFDYFRESAPKVANRNVRGRLTLFEGLIGTTKKIAGAQVNFVGFPKWNQTPSDKNGNVYLSMPLPTNSSFFVEVNDPSANPAYYKARTILTTSNAQIDYNNLFMISRDTVSTMATFNQIKTEPGDGIVIGQVYKDRVPQKGVKLKLSYEKGKAVYIDALPLSWLQATTSRGLFGFLNVVPSFRALYRNDKDKPAMVFQVRPDTVNYVELGRGGSRSLPIKFMDYFDQSPVYGTAHLVADFKKYFTNEMGKTVIPNLDFPPGVVTVEADPDPSGGSLKQHPSTWFTFIFNPALPEVERPLSFVENTVVDETIKQAASKISVNQKLGMLFGSETALLEKNSDCVNERTQTDMARCVEMSQWVEVELFDSNGKEVVGQGPFPWGPIRYPHSVYKLSLASKTFAFFNLPNGEYLVKWKRARKIASKQNGEAKWAYVLQRAEVHRIGERLDDHKDLISVVTH